MRTQNSDEIRVLHVDDEAAIRDLTRQFLERCSDRIAVVSAESAAAGLDRLSTDRIDCVLSDYDMPETDGLTFLDRVRTEHGEVPFVLYTAEGSGAVESAAIAAGATDYLQKGSGSDHYRVLANRIETAVARAHDAP